jgi:hypothetical protein
VIRPVSSNLFLSGYQSILWMCDRLQSAATWFVADAPLMIEGMPWSAAAVTQVR